MVFKDNKLFVLVDTFDDFKDLKLSVDETDTIYITYDNQEQTFGTPDVLWSQLVFVKSNKLIYSKGVIWTDNEFPAYDITSADIERWNNIVSAIKSNWNETDPTSYAYIQNKPSIPTLVKSDWNVSDSTSYAYILNKPNIAQTASGGTEIRNSNGNISLGNTGSIGLNGLYVNITDSKHSITLDQGGDNGIQIIANDGSDGTINLTASSNISVTPGTNSKFYYNNKEVATVDKIPSLVKSDWNETNTSSYAYIQNKPIIPDITGKADKSDAIGSLSLALDQSTYVITLSGTKVDGTAFTVNNTIDLPLESVVVSGNYNNTTKKVELTLKNGSVVDFSVADLVSGLQSEITSANKLSGDLIEDGTNNKVINVKSDWNETSTSSYAYILNKPSIPSLVKSDWNISDTTSYAYILNKPSIPDDTTLVHTTGTEYISGDKSFTGQTDIKSVEIGGATIISPDVNENTGELRLASDSTDGDATLIVGNNAGNSTSGGWTQIVNEASGTNLQQDLDARNNVRADWNVTDTTSYAYILNKPRIPTLVQPNWLETITTSPAYIQNSYIVTDELAYLHTAYDQFISYYEEDSYVIATALTDLDNRINDIDIPTLVKSDWNETNTTSYAYILNKPTIPSLVKSDWNETNTSSYAYIQNKPSIPDDSYLVHKTGSETIGGHKTFNDLVTINDNLRSDNQDSKDFAWIYNPGGNDDYTLQQALNERNNVQSNWNESDTTSYAYIQNKPTIPTLVNANWNEFDTTSAAYIQNKPTALTNAEIGAIWDDVMNS